MRHVLSHCPATVNILLLGRAADTKFVFATECPLTQYYFHYFAQLNAHNASKTTSLNVKFIFFIHIFQICEFVLIKSLFCEPVSPLRFLLIFFHFQYFFI